jgi:hypothetical protein
MTDTRMAIVATTTANICRLAHLAVLGVFIATVAACGGGGGGGSSSLTDAQVNAQAVTAMGTTPVNVTVWDQLNAAGADTARSMAASTDTVVISTFNTIADPTGGAGTIKVFTAVVATGTLNGSRVFQLTSGTLPAGSTPVWVNVLGEDFTTNNTGGGNALEITVAALASPLATPL